MTTLRAPFPWFGGKSQAAPLIWERLGKIDNYVEPFAGSLAVLLGAPSIARTETVNDRDGFVANFWRAVSLCPDEVARFADWPVNENDLHARHAWLVTRRQELTSRLEGDPDYCDAKIAGWWMWGLCLWIGSGWCSGNGSWAVENGQLVHLGDAGRGIHRQRVHLGDAGMGIHRQLVHLGDAGMGIHRQLVHLGNAGMDTTSGTPGGESTASASDGIYEWMRALSARLRRVRVCCGDWTRVCGPTPTTKLGLTGVVLDPPYSEDERVADLYAIDSGSVAADVRRWALEHGSDPEMRIVLCGYEGEHEMPGWERVEWKARGGYGSQRKDGSNDNAERETLWFSPACNPPRRQQLLLGGIA